MLSRVVLGNSLDHRSKGILIYRWLIPSEPVEKRLEMARAKNAMITAGRVIWTITLKLFFAELLRQFLDRRKQIIRKAANRPAAAKELRYPSNSLHYFD
jgi:hypothetical protein